MDDALVEAFQKYAWATVLRVQGRAVPPEILSFCYAVESELNMGEEALEDFRKSVTHFVLMREFRGEPAIVPKDFETPLRRAIETWQ